MKLLLKKQEEVVLGNGRETSSAEGHPEGPVGTYSLGAKLRWVLDCHLVLAGSAVCVVARNVLQVVHRVCPS